MEMNITCYPYIILLHVDKSGDVSNFDELNVFLGFT